ncbi:MAG: helix-turn-helix transcriptional regulator [Bacillota bacterium]|nr:helix-turn-helix transcriptional regulator [Bacillota bacterium]
MNNLMTNIGENIKLLREQSGFTQMNLAKYLKVDQSLISKIEKNERVMTSDLLDKLTALFGISPESLSAESFTEKRITIALRANEISTDDLEMISDINRIALNLKFMTDILGDRDDR